MSFFAKTALQVVSYCVGCLLATAVVLRMIVYAIRKGPRTLFSMKKRPSPPTCMQDPSLGVHGFAHLEDIRLHYVSNGSEDKPLMLLVHGFPEFWYSWRHQLREFKDDYRVVAVDQRGYGDSDKPTSVADYTVDKLANDLRQLIPALGYKKCVLVGHDWGGMAAWALAQTCPEMVDRLIIMNCPSTQAYSKHAASGFSQLKKSWYFSLFQVPYIPELNMRRSDMAVLKNLFTGRVMGLKSGVMSDEDVEAYKYTFQRGGFTAPINYIRALIRYPDFAFSRLTSPDLKVTCPTLIIWGCQDGALDTEMAALSAETVSGEVTVKYIEDCSHWTEMDQPELLQARSLLVVLVVVVMVMETEAWWNRYRHIAKAKKTKPQKLQAIAKKLAQDTSDGRRKRSVGLDDVTVDEIEDLESVCCDIYSLMDDNQHVDMEALTQFFHFVDDSNPDPIAAGDGNLNGEELGQFGNIL
ncbi:hypothetical protein BaRGS_00034649, partial [Batillaria attramentaria]